MHAEAEISDSTDLYMLINNILVQLYTLTNLLPVDIRSCLTWIQIYELLQLCNRRLYHSHNLFSLHLNTFQTNLK